MEIADIRHCVFDDDEVVCREASKKNVVNLSPFVFLFLFVDFVE